MVVSMNTRLLPAGIAAIWARDPPVSNGISELHPGRIAYRVDGLSFPAATLRR